MNLYYEVSSDVIGKSSLSKFLHSQYLVSTDVILFIMPWVSLLHSSFRFDDVPAKAVKSELNAMIPSSATEMSETNM